MQTLLQDQNRVIERLRTLAPSVRHSPPDARAPATRVLDCVLSLNRRYYGFLIPRLSRFEQRYPHIRTVSDLADLIVDSPHESRLLVDYFDYDDRKRELLLFRVVAWLAIDISGWNDYDTQLANLQNWAIHAKPTDYLLPDGVRHIYGFGPAGFQYLRMLFGANTTKPDRYIKDFVKDCVGHSVSEIAAVELLERAASEVGLNRRDVDTTIWEDSARITATCKWLAH